MSRKWHDLKLWEKDICNTSDHCLRPSDRSTKRKIEQELKNDETKEKLLKWIDENL